VAWADTTRVAGLIRAARDSLGADLVVAYVHAGLEYIPVPPLEVVATFRALARSGADAVIGHHPHVPQGLEYVDGRPVLYSLGNFVFRQPQRWTNRGLMAELVLAPGAAPRLSLAPLAAGYTPRFLSGADSAAVMAHVDSISRRIGLPRTGPRRNVARPSPPTTRP
jgi:poly-gamma-glutamate capsule biosynthesis protein CapA/YwtB (metallophosphatase superfamily)